MGTFLSKRKNLKMHLSVKLLFLFFMFSIGLQTVEASTVQSSFNSDDDGWTLSGGNFSWSESGGNPNGFIISEDTISTLMYISAPSKFLGDLLEYDNGIISFDAIEMENTRAARDEFGIITIYSNELSVSKDLAADSLTWEWTTFSAILSADDWGVSQSEWEEILSNVTEIRITIESGYYLGAETVGVDNVMISTVPIPSAFWVFGPGLIGMFAFSRRIKK